MMDLLSGNGVAWVAAFSVLTFLLTLIVVPWLIVQLPADYFVNDKRKTIAWAERHFVLRYLLLVMKNVLGLFVLLVGIAMLVLPGQGILSIIIGVMLMDFPGKFRFERWLISRGPVLVTSNKLRKAVSREPFIFHDD